MATVYINLPVADLAKATAFYEAIEFVKNPQFSNEQASGMGYDNSLYVMLLTHEFTQSFIGDKTIADSHATCEVLNAVQLDSKDAVDALYAKAIGAGGKALKSYDHGFMYGKDFEDLDGHIRELFWMQPQGS